MRDFRRKRKTDPLILNEENLSRLKQGVGGMMGLPDRILGAGRGDASPCLRKLREKIINSLSVHKAEDALIEQAWERERIRERERAEGERFLEQERIRIFCREGRP